ncbi:transposase [Roseomonas sp. BN140053]|uniref:transposase n=1 Tax=Roseomonas sp. BN140053 TaxID=3391898 RepID=UPI0039EBC143
MDSLKLSAEVFTISKTRRPYSPEFRRQMVDLVRAGRLPEDLVREFEPTAQSISAWVATADRQEGRREEVVPGLSASERDELTRLRRENRQLRVERDILSKAAAWFARETGAVTMTNPLRTELVLDAMEMAVAQRRPKDVIHHSDQGSQGGVKRSSQRDVEVIPALRRVPRRASSSQASCAAWC